MKKDWPGVSVQEIEDWKQAKLREHQKAVYDQRRQELREQLINVIGAEQCRSEQGISTGVTVSLADAMTLGRD